MITYKQFLESTFSNEKDLYDNLHSKLFDAVVELDYEQNYECWRDDFEEEYGGTIDTDDYGGPSDSESMCRESHENQSLDELLEYYLETVEGDDNGIQEYFGRLRLDFWEKWLLVHLHKEYSKYFPEGLNSDIGEFIIRNRPDLVPNITSIENITKDMQEYIIQHRPDLASKIQNLDPQLKKKYVHEFELSKVDI